jgi:hypothetical protein
MLANANLKIKQLEELLKESEAREEDGRARIETERKRSEGLYQEIDAHRKAFSV